MSGLLVITRPDDSAGFRCAGLETMEAQPDADMGTILLDIQDEGRYGLVVIDEPLYGRIPEPVMRRLKKKGLPIVINIAMPEKWEEREYGESPVVRLIRKAIGYQIKIKR